MGSADAELHSALENNDCVWEFKDVVDQFRLYLPEVVLAEAYDLLRFCPTNDREKREVSQA
jgi:hypothetical protein